MREVALSTMWWKGREGGLKEFFEKASDFGFSFIELDPFVPEEFIKDVSFLGIKVRSVHAPLPRREIDGRRHTEFSISSFNERERRIAIELIKESVDIASDIRASFVIVHAGEALLNITLEENLRQMYRRWMKGKKEYKELMKRLVEERKRASQPSLSRTEESLREIVRYAGAKGIKIALENRYFYYEIPTQDEMEYLLSKFSPELLGYWHDVGHASCLEKLGFFGEGTWIRKFKKRLVGTHLHDARGLDDHYPPGYGDINWKLIKDNLPKKAVLVCEIGEWNEEESLKDVVYFLKEKGILKT